MQVLAVEGSRASVIGGAPAAAVVFAGDVNARTDADPRVAALEADLRRPAEKSGARPRAEPAKVRSAVRSEKLGEVAAEFDRIHTVERAGSGVRARHHSGGPPRPLLIEAVERGMARSLARSGPVGAMISPQWSAVPEMSDLDFAIRLRRPCSRP